MRIRPSILVPALLALAACEGPHSAVRDLPSDTLVEVNGTRLWVHLERDGSDDGDGDGGGVGDEVMLVVHGGPLLDHGHLVEPLRPLAETVPLVFYDQRLSGRSDGAGEPGDSLPDVSLDLLVDDIEALRAELGLERIHLMGHSWGAGLAVRFALAHPDRVRSLILLSPPAPSFDLADREMLARIESLEPADTAGLGALRASEGMARGDAATIERMLRMSFRGQFVDRTLAEGLEFEIPDDYLLRSEAMRSVGAALPGYDLTGELRGLGVPTLVVYGAAEPAAELSGPSWASLVPDVRVETIEGAKHFPFMEHPAEFERVVTGFLAGR